MLETLRVGRTSITFWCLSSRKYLTSRMADMSSPSLNCPTLIFLIATFLPVVASRPVVVSVRLGNEYGYIADLYRPQHKHPRRPFDL